MSLTTSFEPTPGTARRWTVPLVKHALNMELVLLLGSTVSFFLALASGLSSTVMVSQDFFYDDNIGGYLFALVMPAPTVSFIVNTINVTLFRRRVMHPVANLVLSIILLIGWAATAAILSLTGIFDLHHYYWDPYPRQYLYYGQLTTIDVVSLVAFGSECAMIALYFVSMIIASIGVHRWRTTKYKRYTTASGGAIAKEDFPGEEEAQAYEPAEEYQESAVQSPVDGSHRDADHEVKFATETEDLPSIPWPSNNEKYHGPTKA